jgi:DNA modification methylase
MFETSTFVQDDCRELFARIPEELFDLVYIDPPWYVASDPPPAAEIDPFDDYLLWLSEVLQHSHRVLRSSGALFLNLDPAMSGRIRLIADQIFGRANFKFEFVIPKRSYGSSQKFRVTHDSLLLFAKSEAFKYREQFRKPTDDELRRAFSQSDQRGLFRLLDLTSLRSGAAQSFDWRGTSPGPNRLWRYSREQLDEFHAEGRVVTVGSSLRLKQYSDELTEVPVGTVWDDIAPRLLPSERTKFLTQQPLAIPIRAIQAATEENALVCDPFAGSGTAAIAAHRTGRRWVAVEKEPLTAEIALSRLEREGLVAARDFNSLDAKDVRALKTVTYAFEPVATNIGVAPILRFRLNELVPIEETRHYEFKEIRGVSAARAIEAVVDEYVVAFLNSDGGRIYWGIRDDRMVVGVSLTHEERDRIRRVVMEKIGHIDPPVPVATTRLLFHPVLDGNRSLGDIYVVELVVPRVNARFLFSTASSQFYVRVDGANKRLKGTELQQEFLRRAVPLP